VQGSVPSRLPALLREPCRECSSEIDIAKGRDTQQHGFGKIKLRREQLAHVGRQERRIHSSGIEESMDFIALGEVLGTVIGGKHHDIGLVSRVEGRQNSSDVSHPTPKSWVHISAPSVPNV